jgi:hypothetical protein
MPVAMPVIANAASAKSDRFRAGKRLFAEIKINSLHFF